MSRAVAPVLGTLLLVALTVSLAAVVGAGALSVPTDLQRESPVVLSAAVNSTADSLTLAHESGPPINVREVDVVITVDGTPLRYQPPVPFFNEDGFESSPTGPFNYGSDHIWTSGEHTTIRLDANNAPRFDRGSSIVVRIYHDDALVARVQTTAG